MDDVRRGSEAGMSTDSMQERVVSTLANDVVRSPASSQVKKDSL